MSHLRHDRNKALDDEDAAQLKLGPDFEDDSGAISVSEVKLLLERYNITSDNPVLKKTIEYVQTFARFHDVEIIAAVRQALTIEGNRYRDFETVQITNLCPLEAEEAKALIPSLTPRDDDELLQKLTELAALRKFQT